jgi:murein DD-endopeptidase MepM/ murein hydrolase activator NlpD
MTRRASESLFRAVFAILLAASLVSPLCARTAPHKKRHVAPATSAARRQKREGLKRKLTGVRKKIHEKRVAIQQTKRVEHRITDEIDTVERRLMTTRESLGRAKKRLAFLADRQEMLGQRIEATQRRLDDRKRILSTRVRQNYERGNATYVQVLLRSRTVHDYMSRSYYAQRMAESDAKLVDGIKADQRQLADDKRALDLETAETARLKVQREKEQTQLSADIARRRILLDQVEQQREAMEEALDQMESASRDIESEIRALQQTPRGRARLSRAWTGSFIKPADGPITSGFGSRYHPILHRTRMHTGIDIGAGYGAQIHAAGAGEVIFAGYRGGYGNCVIIDHGGGVSTLYGHCSSLNVSEGQQVSQGQSIARVGSTGLATGPHLHFEVRHNGTPVDPR